jgi:peptidoglycan/xylan/chitin deacetylase (PgdA/CDA1 family)
MIVEPAVAAGAHDSVFVPVLLFHHVKLTRPGDDAIERGLTISPAQFMQELHYLQVGQYHAISASRLVQYLLTGGKLPARPIVLTFDDGYSDVYANVYQVLRRARMTATFFVVPHFLNTPRYLKWSQLEDMQAHGMDIEAHTLTHPDLTLLDAGKLATEVLGSRQEIERRLRKPARIFAYPYGAFDQRVLATVRRAGYWGAFTTRQGWWATRASLLTLPRVYVDNDDTPGIFAGRLRADPRVLVQDPT